MAANNPFIIPVPSAAEAIMGFQRAKKLEDDRADVAFTKDLQTRQLALQNKKVDLAASNKFDIVDLPGVGKVQRNNQTGEFKSLPLSFDQQKDLRAAGKTDVTVTTQGSLDNLEAEEDIKKGAGSRNKMLGEFQQQGVNSNQLLSDLNLLDTLITGANTHKLADVRTMFQSYAEAAGIDVSDIVKGNLGDVQALESIVNRVAPTFRVKGSGSTSDKEFAGLLKAFPSLVKSVPGNKMIVSILRSKGERDRQIADIASAVGSRDENGKLVSSREALRRINALPPMIDNKTADIIRVLGSNKLSFSQTGGPNGGPNAVINLKDNHVKVWRPAEGMWQIIRRPSDL